MSKEKRYAFPARCQCWLLKPTSVLPPHPSGPLARASCRAAQPGRREARRAVPRAPGAPALRPTSRERPNLRRRALPSSGQTGRCRAARVSEEPGGCGVPVKVAAGGRSFAEGEDGWESPETLRVRLWDCLWFPSRARRDRQMDGWIKYTLHV